MDRFRAFCQAQGPTLGPTQGRVKVKVKVKVRTWSGHGQRVRGRVREENSLIQMFAFKIKIN